MHVYDQPPSRCSTPSRRTAPSTGAGTAGTSWISTATATWIWLDCSAPSRRARRGRRRRCGCSSGTDPRTRRRSRRSAHDVDRDGCIDLVMVRQGHRVGPKLNVTTLNVGFRPSRKRPAAVKRREDGSYGPSGGRDAEGSRLGAGAAPGCARRQDPIPARAERLARPLRREFSRPVDRLDAERCRWRCQHLLPLVEQLGSLAPTPSQH